MHDQFLQPFAKLLPRLWGHISIRRRIQMFLLLLLMLVVSVAELVSIGAVLPFLGVLTAPEKVFVHPMAEPVIRNLGLTDPSQLLAPLTLLFAAAAIVSGLLRLVLSWAQNRLSFAIGADFSVAMFRRTLYQPYAVHLARNTSEVIASVTSKADGMVHQAIMPFLLILNAAVLMSTVLLALLALQPAVTATAMGGMGGIYAVVILATRKRLVIDSRIISQQQSRVIKTIQEAFGGIRDVLIDGTQEVFFRIYRDADKRLRRAQSNIAIVASSPRFIVEALGMAFIAAMAYALASRPGGLSSAIPIIGTLALAAQRMLPLMQQAYASWSSMRGGQSGLSDALSYLDQPLPDQADKPAPQPTPFLKTIKLKDLSFRYAENTPWVLKEINLCLDKGARIGFIGSTGNGKSTLLDIVMGLLSPTQGTISIDDISITVQNCRAWQSHIAHVPQSIFLADATIAENIAFGLSASDIDHERVRFAAQRAQIASTIESWEHGYATVVGERGVRLSGGQRQRIGIARALYKQADLIVFDEATSALDEGTERAVMDSIKTLGDDLTILMVAHRLTTLRDCTQIIELKNGKVSRIGTYDQIIGSQ